MNQQLAVLALAVNTLSSPDAVAVSRQAHLPACPPPGDTLSLLQPSDSAFADAQAVAARFDHAGLGVRCITRSVWTSLAGVGKVAGLQTVRGTVTVFFVPIQEHFELQQRPTAQGYEMIYSKGGVHAARTALRTDAKRAVAWIARGGRYYQITEPTLAREVERILGR